MKEGDDGPAPQAGQLYGSACGYLGAVGKVGASRVPSCIMRPCLGPAVCLGPVPFRSQRAEHARHGPGGYCWPSGNQGTTGRLPAAQEATPDEGPRGGPAMGAKMQDT